MRLFPNRLFLVLPLWFAVSVVAETPVHPKEAVARGWLSDEVCARGRAESGVFTATSPRCAKECVKKGRKIVLIDPDRKAIFDIRNQDLARKEVGNFVEIAGQLDLRAKVVSIASVKMLRPGTASCARPTLKD